MGIEHMTSLGLASNLMKTRDFQKKILELFWKSGWVFVHPMLRLVKKNQI